MDLEKYRSKYYNVSMEELEKFREDSSESVFEFIARSIHEDRERVKNNGKPDLEPHPLIQVLSVSVRSKNENENKPLVIYGKIHAEYRDSGNMVVHELYERERGAAEILSINDNLTLISPGCFSCPPEHACIPLFRSRIKVMLFDGADNVFAKQCFYLDDDDIDVDDNYERVKTKLLDCELGFLTFKYIAIPFGINCRVEVMFCNNRQGFKKHDSINVNGKVVVRYGNTHGNYSSEECILFQKQENDSERVEFDEGKVLQLSRCWVTMPAYSSLAIGVNLLEFETKREIVNDSIEFIPEQAWMSCGSFVSSDIEVQVLVAWFSPKPMGRCRTTRDYHFLRNQPLEIEERDVERGISTEEIEVMDTEVEDESSDDESDDSSNLNLPWSLRPHKSMPLSSPAIEIFSVFIDREKSKAIQIYGTIDVLSDDRGICNIFKRDEKDALVLPEDVKSLPIPDGSRVFEDFNPLEMKFDIKDVEGRLAIKGYVDWAASILDSSLWHEKQLCSFIQGLNGFVAIHYSIFSEAVGAYIKVFLNLKSGDADVYPKLCGSVIAQYGCYDYSSRYNKNYFRNMLFRKTQNDPIQLSIDSSIPLSRSMVVVPSYSSLIIDVDLDFEVSDQKFSCAEKIGIEIGEGCKTLETNECFIRIELDWCEIK